MPKFIAIVHIQDATDEELAEAAEAMQSQYFYRRFTPQDGDKPRTLPPNTFEGHSDLGEDELATILARAVRDATGRAPYVITIEAETFGLYHIAGSLIGIEDLDPDRDV